MLAHLEEREAERAKEEFARQFLEKPTDFNLRALARRGWVAVPVEDNISERRASQISAAAREAGITEGIAVTTEPEIYVEGLRVSLTKDGILEFDANCMLRAFLLVAEGELFAILVEGDYYYLVAGPPKFVERSVGGSIVQAQAEFLDYAKRPQWPQQTRDLLLAIHARYFTTSIIPSEKKPPPSTRTPSG